MPYIIDATLLCRTIGHRHSRRIWHSDEGYRSPCKRCGIELGRARDETRWHVVPPATPAGLASPT